ncbi:hypothetical protein BCR44DRAFT_35910 [Catenaria anguillulae PL171]|uniref:Ankyrin repeat-containing domain protein n=1 Tax=Catenaria anguillulae PL171 TaxID=765915 RepID=A0A1Y2HEV0_9FUNG|nr:hypothetical protein BCR44DRAFT_35910 [Catenaria anguillulae PL171]
MTRPTKSTVSKPTPATKAAAPANAHHARLDLAHPADPPPPPPLPAKVIDNLLALSIRLTSTPLPLGGPAPTPLLAAISVLPRTSLPTTLATALTELWYISADTAARHSSTWLLDVLIDLERRHIRPLGPLSTSASGLGSPASRGDLEFIAHWQSATSPDLTPLLSVKPVPALLALAREQAAAHGHLAVLDLAQQAKWPMGGMASISRDLVAASSAGHVDVLKHWNSRVIFGHAPEAALVGASKHGHVQVLDWWYNHSPTSFKCPPAALLAAAQAGHVNVLRWWKDHGYQFAKDQVPVELMDLASKEGCVEVLEWINIESDLDLVYSASAMDWAAAKGYMFVLEWWVDSEMDIKVHHFVDWACVMGKLNILVWWEKERWMVDGLGVAEGKALACPYESWDEADEVADDGTLVGKHITVDTLQWRMDADLPLKFSARGMRLLSAAGRLDVLKWIKANWVEFEHDASAVDAASRYGHADVLAWWKDEAGVDVLQYSEAAIQETASRPCLDWWTDSGLEIRGSMLHSPHLGQLDILQWALAHEPDSTRQLVEASTRLALPLANFSTLTYLLTTTVHFSIPSTIQRLLSRTLGCRICRPIRLVQWMAANGIDMYPPTRALVTDVLPAAIRAGCVHIVHWACTTYGKGAVGGIPSESVNEAIKERGELTIKRYARVWGVEVKEGAQCVVEVDEEDDDDDW